MLSIQHTNDFFSFKMSVLVSSNAVCQTQLTTTRLSRKPKKQHSVMGRWLLCFCLLLYPGICQLNYYRYSSTYNLHKLRLFNFTTAPFLAVQRKFWPAVHGNYSFCAAPHSASSVSLVLMQQAWYRKHSLCLDVMDISFKNRPRCL